MKNVYKQKREQGFTIIEVMIVLAIAAVILLIVLLAVPALQRNSRNTQRNNDAAQIAAAVNTCLANHNGLTASCNAQGPTAVDVVSSRLGQLQTVNFAAGAGSVSSANVQYGVQCNAAGDATVAGTPRGFAITFAIETSGAASPRCVDS